MASVFVGVRITPAVRVLIRDAIEDCLVDPEYRDADVETDALLREIAALPPVPDCPRGDLFCGSIGHVVCRPAPPTQEADHA